MTDTDITDDDKKQKINYTLISGITMGVLSYYITKDKTIGLIGGTITSGYIYNNFEKVKQQVKDISGDNTDTTGNEKVDDREWYKRIIDYSPPVLAGQLWSSIF